jgi:hypothetical protein
MKRLRDGLQLVSLGAPVRMLFSATIGITEHPTGDGNLYLCAINDLHSSRIVGYSIADRMKAVSPYPRCANAVELRRPVATVVHSDRGQFRSRKYVREVLQEVTRCDPLAALIGTVYRADEGDGCVAAALAAAPTVPVATTCGDGARVRIGPAAPLSDQGFIPVRRHLD